MPKHIYVLDTCVLLHDPHAMYKFEENDIYVPLAVIDDLDELKTKRENVGWMAREVLRQFNKFHINELTKGVKINEKGGKIFVYNHESPIMKGEVPTIVRSNSDNALIETCRYLRTSNPKRKVCLVTKDVGLMVRAASWQVTVENYRHDMLDPTLYPGFEIIDLDTSALVDKLYKNGTITIDEVKKSLPDKTLETFPNQFIVLKYNDSTATGIVKKGEIVNCFSKDNNKEKYMGIKPKNFEQKLSVHLLNDDNVPLVCLEGKAGTGKTICALAVGLQKVADGVYDKVVVIKPMVPVGGKEIGYLPGDKFSKISAWLGPITDSLEQLIKSNGDKAGPLNFEELCEDGIIEVEAMTFIQGRSITNAYIILDEAENVTGREARMLVERCGKDSKIVMLGDLTQIENPYLDQFSCGLTHTIQGAKSTHLAGSVRLKKVERSELAEVASEIFKKGMFDFYSQ